MADILVRGLEERVVSRLKQRAKRNGRSLQGEVKLIIERAAKVASIDESLEALRSLRAATGRGFGDSAALIREDRER